MSERETRIPPQVLIAVGGMNERPYLTEIGPQDWVNLTGTFPEWNGIASRLWGKRTLAKYADSIYGIHQFWTPYGYAGGIYQFENDVDGGPWRTPTTRIDLDPIPPPSDRRGYTVDDFGNPWDVGDWGTGDACILSFLNGGTDHTVCNPPIDRNGTVDDSNGGPAGDGRRCSWQEVTTDYPVGTFMQSKESAAGIDYLDTDLTPNVTANPDKLDQCVPSMGAPPPLGHDVAFGAYSSVSTLGSFGSTQTIQSTLIFTAPSNPYCAFNQNFSRSANGALAGNNRAVFNFASLQDSSSSITRITMVGTSNGSPFEADLGIPSFTENFQVDARSFRTEGPVTHFTSLDSSRTDAVSFSIMRIYRRVRVCV